MVEVPVDVTQTNWSPVIEVTGVVVDALEDVELLEDGVEVALDAFEDVELLEDGVEVALDARDEDVT